MATWRNGFFSPVRECGAWDEGTGTGVCNLTYCEEIASMAPDNTMPHLQQNFPKHNTEEKRQDMIFVIHLDPNPWLLVTGAHQWDLENSVLKSLVLSHEFFLMCRNSIESPGGAQAIHLAEALSWRLRVCQVLATFVSNHKASGTPSPSGHTDLPPALVRAPSLPRKCGWTQVKLLGSRRGPGTRGLI